ncbi:baseplate protein [Bacteroidia bacterium]|nr:baseplate protein [Bacteroidia bacterium]
MATTTVPQFVERDPDVIMAESKTMLETLLGRELQPAQLEQLMLQFIVYREVLLLNRFNAGMSQMLYQFSTAPILDYIAGLVSVERLPEAQAGCTVRFTFVAGHGNIVLPEGTRVSTSDGKVIFETIDDLAVAQGTEFVDLPVLAEVAGKSANNYAQGAVNKILDPVPFVLAASNLDVTGGGSDEESDEQLRERIKLAPNQYSTAGSRGSYLFHAKSANTLITDVSISSPIPGTVLIVPLTGDDDTPAQVMTDIYNACSAEDVRPLTDTVLVSAPEFKEYAIEVNVTLYESVDSAAAQSDIMAALEEYAQVQRSKLGRDVILSQIVKACRIPAVYDVSVVEPVENIVVEDIEFSTCTGITVNITGFNHG